MIRARAVPILPALWLFVAGCASTGPAGASSDETPSAPAAATEAEQAAAAERPAAEVTPGRSGYFTGEQAERGRATFREICSECHYSSEFRGAQFEYEWRRRTVRDLFRTISRTMPEDAPGGLAPGQYADVVSYILELNGLPAGTRELPADAEALRAYPLDGLGRSGG